MEEGFMEYFRGRARFLCYVTQEGRDSKLRHDAIRVTRLIPSGGTTKCEERTNECNQALRNMQTSS